MAKRASWPRPRTWTVTDVCGLTDVCVQTFEFTDTTPPEITCPPDMLPIEWPAGFNTTPVGPDTPRPASPQSWPPVCAAATAR